MAEAAWRRRFRAPRVTLPQWARDDSERLLYASNATGTWELYVWDRIADVHRQVTDRPEGTIHGQLDPSGREVWWFDDDRGNELGTWVVEPFDDTTGDGRRPAAEAVPAAYSTGLALGTGVAVVGTSTDEGSRIYAVRDGGAATIYEHREEAEVGGLSRDETLVCVVHSEHGDARHPALRVLTAEGDTVGSLWEGQGQGLWPAGWSRVPGDRRMLVLHERRDLPRPMIWWPESGETRDLVVDLPGEIDARWYPDGKSVLLMHDHRGRVELYRLDLESGELEDLGIPPGTVTGASVRPDGEVWFGWSDAATPPEVRSPSAVVLRPPGESAPAGVRYRDVTAGDVHAFVAEPDGARPHPTILLIHGGPEAHDGDQFFPSAQAWVDHGYAVVLVNYRGSSGYGKTWRDALTGNPGLTELKDIAAVHDQVVAEGIADPERTILAGGSWGGYLTLLGLGTQPERWALGIAAVPVADYIAAYEDEMEPLRAFDRALFEASPEDDPDRYRLRSPITYVEEVRVPVLILAGENDPRCPIRQIDNYLERLRALDKPHEVYRYDAGHGSLRVDEVVRQVEAELSFAARHLGTTAPQ